MQTISSFSMLGLAPAEADIENYDKGVHSSRHAQFAISYSTDYNRYSCCNRVIASCCMHARRRVSSGGAEMPSLAEWRVHGMEACQSRTWPLMVNPLKAT